MHTATNITRPTLPEIWDDGAGSERSASLRGSPKSHAGAARRRSWKRPGKDHAVYRSPGGKSFADTQYRSTQPKVFDHQAHSKGETGSTGSGIRVRQHSKRALRWDLGERSPWVEPDACATTQERSSHWIYAKTGPSARSQADWQRKNQIPGHGNGSARSVPGRAASFRERTYRRDSIAPSMRPDPPRVFEHT